MKDFPEMLSAITFSNRQQEILKLYAQRIQIKITKLRADVLQHNHLTEDATLPDINELQKELSSFEQYLGHTGMTQNVRLTSALGFWFVDEMQIDIDPMNSVPDASFTHSPRQDMRTLGGEGTFYELLHLFYMIGAPFIRREGVNAIDKYRKLLRPNI